MLIKNNCIAINLYQLFELIIDFWFKSSVKNHCTVHYWTMISLILSQINAILCWNPYHHMISPFWNLYHHMISPICIDMMIMKLFDWCNQSLKWLLPQPIHPPTHPGTCFLHNFLLLLLCNWLFLSNFAQNEFLSSAKIPQPPQFLGNSISFFISV